ncbi:hypothetical protein TCAL_05047 [Tigriopus californicus]|uniref:Uncharacterized protein n=2 Tax=Tigriopus californicus TaxID=6832 RepID=A0A553P8N9_TIGCA|nr:hypothetical protein TCAL_05047 [Tigriopus californicus]|eukprot:TCALIF_05047-PA protein Name:"Similar to BIRC5 Baculoviral IAP repeat-containing protein 5 (Canis familiaris)" AED:0.10 eAED:0.10 QI:96/1/1/1/1/1/3/249/167
MAPRKANQAKVFYTESLMGRVDLVMALAPVRTQSFEDWPFDESDSPCRPDKMSEAGFYFVGYSEEPDLVRCYYCRRELGGWEPNDDPWTEHARRPCPFIKLGKKPEQLTVEDLYRLEDERLAHIFMTQCEAKLEELKETGKSVRDKIIGLPNSTTNAKQTRSKRKRK